MTVRRIVLRAALATLAGGFVLVIPAVPPSAAAGPACAASQATAAQAAAMAKACGRAVEDLSRRTEASTTVHNPDGTQVLTEYAEPRWARGPDGSWGDIDTTLRLVNGAVVPGRTILPVTFSAGGVAPLARLAKGGDEISLTWPGTLPAPALAGDTATYPDVLPGVDLRLTAQAEGFAEVLVVKTRAAAAGAALSRVMFGLGAKGVTVAGRADGGADARDARGETVFASPTPFMWDSGVDPAAATSGNGRLFPRMARMGASFASSSVSITPDRALLTSPDAVFPLFIDPSWTGHIFGNGWKNVADRSDVVNSTSFTLLDGATKGDVGSGLICDNFSGSSCTSPTYHVRSFFTMDTSGAVGKHVLSATFNVTQKWSFTCNTTSDAKLWITGAISSGTTWANQPGWDGGHTATTPANRRIDSAFSCAGAGNDAFDATGIVQYALSQGWNGVTLGFQAVNESTTSQWKRFDAASMNLAIVYNSYPNVPDTFVTANQSGCVTGSSRPRVAVNNPVLQARVTDPDGAGEGDINGTLRGDFAWESFNTATSTWSALGSALGTPQANGTTSPAPAPTFAQGIYRWHVRAADSWSYSGGSGTDYSAYGPWCEFQVDLAPPSTPVLTPDAQNAPFMAGKTVRVTASPGGSPPDADITGYNWWVIDGAGTHATTFVPGTTAVIDWTPIVGVATIYVQAKDQIQVGPTASYGFNAAQPSTELASWPLSDPGGSPTAFDATGNGHDATGMGDAGFGQPGRILNGATTFGLDAMPGSGADTSGPVLDTSGSFSVTAWAETDSRTSNLVVASQSGGAHVPFTLGYVGGSGEDRWEFVTYNSSGTVTGRVRSTKAPVVGVWTHLAGTYNAVTDTLVLFVDGVAQGSATGVTTWAASGPFQIGHGIGEEFNGSIAEVRVWNRPLPAAEVFDIVDPTSDANVSTANVGQWLVEPESCFGDPTTCLDSSAYGHDLKLSGDVSLTPQGQSGSGLLYGGTNGVASTIDPNTGWDAPVLRTDQSFTISAWVKLGVMPTDTVTAVGQSGSFVSAYYLGVRTFADGSFRWAFAMKDTDSDGGSWVTVSGAPINSSEVGAWRHLIAVYNASAQTMTLYVNGTAVGSASRPAAPWNAFNEMTIGSVLYTGPGEQPHYVDWWNGTIDTVYAYAGAVPASSISRIP